MISNSFCLAVLLIAVRLSGSLGKGMPYFKSDDEAPYTLIKKTRTYEIRSYPAAKYVCYDHIGSQFTKRQQANSFLTLFDYHGGENAAGANISFASPTTVRTVFGADSQNNLNLYQMCVYLPIMYQESPPEPIEDGVFILQREKLTVAARQFDHYMMEDGEWEAQMEMLRSVLTEANEPNMDFNDFYGAAFDPPFDKEGRPNEVWIVKKK